MQKNVKMKHIIYEGLRVGAVFLSYVVHVDCCGLLTIVIKNIIIIIIIIIIL